MANIICSILFSKRYQPDDADLKQVLKFHHLMMEGPGKGDPVTFLPWLRFFPLRYLKLLQRHIDVRDQYLGKMFHKHKTTFDKNNIRDYTDGMMKLISEEPIPKGAGITCFTDKDFKMNFAEIFVAGNQTSISAFTWSIVYLLHWPEYQDKIHDEIVSVIGKERYPTLADREMLPLTRAVVMETLRLSSVAALAVPHKSTEGATIGGKNIPKDAMILFNVWNIHRDERHWNNPHKFDPHRWLNEEGNYSSEKIISFMPFGIGKRTCLAKSAALSYLFLIIARLLKDFQITPELGKPIPDLDGIFGNTTIPKPFSVVFKSR